MDRVPDIVIIIGGSVKIVFILPVHFSSRVSWWYYRSCTITNGTIKSQHIINVSITERWFDVVLKPYCQKHILQIDLMIDQKHRNH